MLKSKQKKARILIANELRNKRNVAIRNRSAHNAAVAAVSITNAVASLII